MDARGAYMSMAEEHDANRRPAFGEIEWRGYGGRERDVVGVGQLFVDCWLPATPSCDYDEETPHLSRD